MTSPVQFGFRFPWQGLIARRNPEKRVEQFKKEALLTQQTESAQAIRQALATPLFTDKHGEFRGWDLLLLLSKSGDRSGDVVKTTFISQFSEMECKEEVQKLLRSFADLGLTKTTYSSYWRLTEKGHQSLKLFKKTFKKPGPLGKLGNYSFGNR